MSRGGLRRLNELYAELGALHRVDRDPSGFRWIVGDDREQSVLAYLRSADGVDPVLVVMNNTPEPRRGYRLGAPTGTWNLVANSDDAGYGGSGMATPAELTSDGDGEHGFDTSVTVDLPPLGIVVYRLTEAAEVPGVELSTASTSADDSDDVPSRPDAAEPAG